MLYIFFNLYPFKRTLFIMRILDFLKTMLPTFKKKDLLGDLNTTLSNLNECTIPVYDKYAQEMRSFNFSTQEAKSLISAFQSHVKQRKGNIIVTIAHGLHEAADVGASMQKSIDKRFQDDISRDGLTYNEAQTLQILSAFSFFERYARRLLSYLIILETGKFDNGNSMTSLTDGHKQYIIQYFTPFCMLLNAYTQGAKAVLDALKNVPELEIIPENDAAIVAIQGKDKVDPFRMGLISANVNPFYWWGMRKAISAVKRYDEAKEERNMLELRLMHIKNLQQGQNNPDIEKEIQYNEDRLSRIQAEIRDFEEEYLK